MTRQQVLEQIAICEKSREFDKHIDPINYDLVIKVDKDYHYTKKGTEWLKYSLENAFIVRPFTFWLNKFHHKTKVVGKENLKVNSGAVITCNHFYMFDCLIVKGALGQKLFTTAAPFNNMSGFLGEMMRAGGMLPMSEDKSGMRNFMKAINTKLQMGKYVLFYPEQAMWWNYKKPRPYKEGAFRFAVKNNVPVIPCFITMVGNGKFDDEGIEKNNYVLNIGKPIYKNKELSDKENIEYLMNENFNAIKNIYENFYKCKLSYD